MPRILIAQEDHTARRYLSTALRSDGYSIIELTTAAELEAYLLADSGRTGTAGVRAVIAELDPRDLAAGDLLACLHLCDSRTPVILLTPYADRRTLDQANRLGVVAIFGKSYDVDVLRQLVRYITSMNENIATFPDA